MQNALFPNPRERVNGLIAKHKSIISEWALFLIHPVSALILAFLNYKSSYAKNFLWIFVAYYGFTMVISDVEMDANRYRDSFIALAESPVTAQNFISLLYQEDANFVDAVQPLITFLVSIFTNDYRVLFAIFGLVFGYFYSRNIWFLLERSGSRVKSSSCIFIFIFIIVIGFWQINGFRMWTAAHVFFFGAIQYLIDNKKKGIIIAAFSVFFHFSFILPVGLLLFFTVLPKKIDWFFWFFIITFFISELNVRMLTETLADLLPGVFVQRINSYTSDVYMEAVSDDLQTRNWRFHFYSQSIKWVATGFLGVIYFFGKKFIKENRNYNILFCYTIFFMAVVNLVSQVPSVNRFYLVVYLFVFAFIFLYLQHAPTFYLKRAILLISFPLLIFYSLGMINISFMTIGMITLIGNPIFTLLPYGDIDVALIDLLK